MAKITLSNLAHSYTTNPVSDQDFALKTLNHEWDDGAALSGRGGCRGGNHLLCYGQSGYQRASHPYCQHIFNLCSSKVDGLAHLISLE